MISAAFSYEKKKIEIDGLAMAAVDAGDGDPIVFLHGNATSSYMWRNILPHCEGLGRLIAIDNIGQGDSDKLPDSGPTSYLLKEHQHFIDRTLDALGVTENVTLVMHDWGGTLGLTWARAHADRIKGLAFCEAILRDHPSWDEYPEALRGGLRRVRGPEGREMVMEDNFFVERIFTAGVMRDIEAETMAEIRRPYLGAPENRRPTLSWVRQIPVEGQPAFVAELVEDLSDWMAETPTPKLFIRAEPGQIMFEKDIDMIATWPALTTAMVKGLHHPQEDSPDDIGRAIAEWYRGI